MEIQIIKCLSCGAGLKNSMVCSYCGNYHINKKQDYISEPLLKSNVQFCTGQMNVQFNKLGSYCVSGSYKI